MKSEFEKKAHQAAEAYLMRKGYNVIDPSPRSSAIGFVAKSEEGAVVFISFAAKAAEDMAPGLPEEPCSRAEMEQAAAEWLGGYEADGDFSVRFDSIAVLALGKSRALLRHHKDMLG